MTLPEAAVILGVTPDTLRQAIHRGSLRGRKVGRDWTVTPAEVERYRREHRRRTTDALIDTAVRLSRVRREVCDPRGGHVLGEGVEHTTVGGRPFAYRVCLDCGVGIGDAGQGQV